jgi:hypothetical protein
LCFQRRFLLTCQFLRRSTSFSAAELPIVTSDTAFEGLERWFFSHEEFEFAECEKTFFTRSEPCASGDMVGEGCRATLVDGNYPLFMLRGGWIHGFPTE